MFTEKLDKVHLPLPLVVPCIFLSCLIGQELDPVTLHNQALMNMEEQPTQGFEKLQFLLQQNPFPPVTFGNLLILYIKFEVSSDRIEIQQIFV